MADRYKPITPSLMEGDTVARFLSSFVVSEDDLQNLRRENPALPLGRLPRSIDDVLDDVREVWWEKGFLSPAALKFELLNRYMFDAPQQLRDCVAEIEQYRNRPEAVTGYLAKEHAYLATGLAHLYTLETGLPMSMVEVDFSNMGGTNAYFETLLEKEQGVAGPDAAGMAQRLTDRAVRFLSASLVSDIAAALPHEKIIPIRVGGDELRILVTGLSAGNESGLLAQTLHAKIEERVSGMGLGGHPHPKDPENPVRNGFGAALAVQDLGRVVEPDALVQVLDERIRMEKEKIGHARLKKNGDTPREDITIAGFNAYLDAVAPETRNTPRSAMPDEVAAGPATVDNILKPLAQRRFERALAYYADQGIDLHAVQRHYLKISIDGLQSEDPAAQVLMPQAMIDTLQGTLDGLSAYRDAFAATAYQTRHALGGARLDDVAEVKPCLMAVSFHNLAGMNEALGHHNADLVLRHMAENVIARAIRREALPEGAADAFAIAHHGGGNFTAMIQPGGVDAAGNAWFVSPRRMDAVRHAVKYYTRELNNSFVLPFLRQNGVRVDDVTESVLRQQGIRRFADIADPKARVVAAQGREEMRYRIHGLHVTMASDFVDADAPAAAHIGRLRDKVDRSMEELRLALARRQKTAGMFNTASQSKRMPPPVQGGMKPAGA